MDWLNQFADILRDNWAKVLLILSTPVVGGLTVWQLGKIVVKAIQNGTAKKYTAKQKEYRDEVVQTINGLKEFIAQQVKEEVKESTEKIAQTFNDLQLKTQETKQAIYEKIFDTKMEIKEITQEIKADVETEFEEIKQEIIEEEEQIKEEENEIINEQAPEKVDLL